MNLLQTASATVQPALKAGRVGTPVFARIVAHTVEDHGQIEPALAAALETAGTWIGDKVLRLAALGRVSAGQITAGVLFSRGQTALVSAGVRGQSPPLLEAAVVGNRGSMVWEPAADEAEAMRAVAAPSDEAKRLLELVRKSLTTGQPVAADGSPPGKPAKPPPAGKARQLNKTLKKTKPPFGVLLVSGNHTHQENYARSLAADKRCRLIAVTDEADVSPRRRKLNEALADELNIPYLADYRDVLARDDVQIVSICAEPQRRGEIMVRCAQAGKHLYLDKPMCASVQEAEKIVDAAEQAGVVHQMFSQVRNPVSARLREVVRGGSLGDVAALHFDLSFAKGYAGGAKIERPRAEVKRPKNFETVDSKREMTNVGVYPLALLNWLLGERVRRVCSFTGNYFFAEHQQNNMEDFGVMLLELADGRVASISASRFGWRSHPAGGLNRNYVIGNQGVASIDLYRPRLIVSADEAPWQPPPKDPQDPMGFWSSTLRAAKAQPRDDWLTPSSSGKNDFEYFLDCIQHGRPSDLSAAVGAETTRVLMAAYESAATGTFVLLP